MGIQQQIYLCISFTLQRESSKYVCLIHFVSCGCWQQMDEFVCVFNRLVNYLTLLKKFKSL